MQDEMNNKRREKNSISEVRIYTAVIVLRHYFKKMSGRITVSLSDAQKTASIPSWEGISKRGLPLT